MKRIVKNILVAGAFVIGATGLFAGQASNDWVDQLMKAKTGRAPFAEARQHAEQANTVYREEATPKAVMPANTWFEDFYRAKYGRSSPTEEARLRAERANTVYREEATPKAAKPANTWRDDFWKAKFGRPYPTENK
ncbi:MAG TPA: hypothetical protein VEV41_22780 [Terriglobales bacterium]|nr:hypothetical protein [Terriglobales bacterium]